MIIESSSVSNSPECIDLRSNQNFDISAMFGENETGVKKSEVSNVNIKKEEEEGEMFQLIKKNPSRNENTFTSGQKLKKCAKRTFSVFGNF